MKGIYFLIKNRLLGKKIVYYEGDRLDRVDSNTILSKFKSNVTALNTPNETPKKNHYGMSEDYFNELFLPEYEVFKNDFFDIIVDQNRFICLSYYFPDSEDENAARKQRAE